MRSYENDLSTKQIISRLSDGGNQLPTCRGEGFVLRGDVKSRQQLLFKNLFLIFFFF